MMDPSGKTQKLICSRCKEPIGNIVVIDGEDMVQVGALIVAEIDGNCIKCGEAFHFSLNARRLERLIKRIKTRKT